MQPTRPVPGRLDDEDYARFVWRRFWRIQWWMTLTGLAVALAVAGFLWWTSGPLPWLFVALIVVGVSATVWMAAALMGLMFLSNGTGHDLDVVDPVSKHVPIDD